MSTPNANIPLDKPYPGATIGIAFSRFWRKYATFSGRASRSEFWWWVLVQIIANVVFQLIGVFSGGISTPGPDGQAVPGPGLYVFSTIAGLWALATIVPSLALYWRRLHDSNRPGPFYFLGFIPLVGWIILLVFTLSSSDPAGKRFDAR